MNYRLVLRQLGAVAFLVALGMLLSMPFAFEHPLKETPGERAGLFGLSCSIAVAVCVGFVLRRLGRRPSGELFQKEAIAVVVLSWFLVTFLGALPYLFSGVSREPDVKMNFADAMFESVSGFSTTGSSVLSELEDPNIIPRCIVFWRSCTHFYGGIGILVLLVVLGGRNANRKNLANTEMSNIIAERPTGQIKKITGILFSIYVSLNVLLTAILLFAGVPLLDSLCHAFGAIATGGFSTYNASVGHFASMTDLNAPLIEWSITIFCLFGATNFMLFFWCVQGKPGILFRNEEWRTFLGIYLVVSLAILISGLAYGDFNVQGTSDQPMIHGASIDEKAPLELSVRYAFFNTASMLTTTGYCTDEFDRWNGLSRFLLLAVLFVGGCAGSTAGSIKVVRHLVCWKMMRRGTETAYRPTLVRPIFANGTEFDRERQTKILLYFVTYVIVFALATATVLAIEPTSKWVERNLDVGNKMDDVISCVASTMAGAGPAYGISGPRRNFGPYCDVSKFLFCGTMLLGRLEIYILLALFSPGFWIRKRG